MRPNTILASVQEYYDGQIRKFGATPKGVDWNSPESQRMRFEQLLKVCDPTDSFSIIDYGCGYGALVDFMMEKGYTFNYCGYDISDEMVTKANALHKENSNCQFTTNLSQVKKADYTIASGIFNVRLQTNSEEWDKYILETLNKISNLSTKGFAFNVLTMYSDPEYMRSDLYYANPLTLFDYCKKNFSKYVALLHDYPLYEFTILAKKSGG
jgi:SAM-dependent methyltransferase